MNTYIIQMFSKQEKNSRNLLGIVEVVGTDGKRAFTNIRELWEIVNNGDNNGLIIGDAKDSGPGLARSGGAL